MRTKKSEKQEVKIVVAPRLVKAADLVAREAAEAQRAQEVAAARVVKPIVRQPRNAVEARDIFNSLFNQAA